jgi:GNAT superfamily N-acetyltransferase
MATLLVEAEPAHADIRFLQDKLYEYNVEQTGSADGKWLCIFVRDENGNIAAGLHGWTWSGCGKIENLWVRHELRGQGYGRRLLQAAEGEAAARGCDRLFLDTFSFQAPLFYQKLGYEIIGTLEDFPAAPHKQYQLRKWLGSPTC